LPIPAIKATLRSIAPDLRQNVVVADTSPIKGQITGWQADLEPGHHYIGLVPALSPHHITDLERPAHADLFRGGVMGIISPPGTPGTAVKLAADLVALLGAESFFMDLQESDNLMASAHLLPQLLSAALIHQTVDGPGWPEMRRLAGRAYAAVSLPAASQDEPQALAQAALINPAASLRALDAYLQTLTNLRTQIAAGDEAQLTSTLSQAAEARQRWWSERTAGNWLQIEAAGPKLPPKTGFLERLLGLGRQK
jgi:prephenate dehydrogenase